MEWLYLVLGIGLEIGGVTAMKLSHGFTRLVPSVLMFLLYGLSLSLLTLALKKIDIGVGNTLWAGAGTMLVAAIGIVWFHEPVTPLKVGSILLITLGVIGLTLSGQ